MNGSPLWRLGRIERRRVTALVAAPAAVALVGRLVDAINLVSIAAGAIGAVALAEIAIMMSAEIVLRAVGHPLPFSWEYGAYLMSASFFLASGFTLLSGGHVRVALFLAASRPFVAWVLELLAALVATAVFALIAWSLSMQFATRGTTSYTPMQTPMVVPTAVAATGATVLFLQGIGRLFGLLIGREDAFVFARSDVAEG